MKSVDVLDIVLSNTKWYYNKNKNTNEVLSDLLQIVRMEDFVSLVTNNQKDYSSVMVKEYNKNIIDLKNNLISWTRQES